MANITLITVGTLKEGYLKEAVGEYKKRLLQYARVEEINLLPYHRLGMDKYEGLGRPYPMGDILPPSEAHMEMLKGICEEEGLKAKIGG